MYPSPSQKYRLLEMVALCGNFLLTSLPSDPSPLWRKAHYRVKGTKTAADSLSGSFKGLSPDGRAKQMLLAQNPERFVTSHREYRNNQVRSEVTRRLVCTESRNLSDSPKRRHPVLC